MCYNSYNLLRAIVTLYLGEFVYFTNLKKHYVLSFFLLFMTEWDVGVYCLVRKTSVFFQ